MKIRKSLDFITVTKYTILFVLFYVFNNLEVVVLPYSSAIFVCALLFNFSLVFTPILYLGSFILCGEMGLLASGGVFVLVILPITLVYKSFKPKNYYEFVAYTLIGMLGFIFLGNTQTQVLLEKRILTAILTTFLSFLCIIVAHSLMQKGFKFKLDFEEVFAIGVMTAILGLGICNTFSPFIYKCICVFLILSSCYVFRRGLGSIFGSVFALGLAIYYNDINYVSIFLVYGIFSECFIGVSRYLSAIAIVLCDYLLQVAFSIYASYTYLHFISVLLGSVCFCVLPTQILNAFKDKLYAFREKQLVKQCINRNRSVLSNKLFDLSSVFSEIANSFNLLKKQDISQDGAKKIMQKEILGSVCRQCMNYDRCKPNERAISSAVGTMLDIGFAKGKLSLIDLPKELATTCVHPNNILYGLNKMLADYRAKLIENANLGVGRDLIACQALGISEILRALALESGSLLKFNNKLEKQLTTNLFKAGFIITELLIYGESDRLSVSMVIAMKEYSFFELQNVVSKTLGVKMAIDDKTSISEEKEYITLRKSDEYDAVFGIAKATKDGSAKSGDTHSMTKIACDKFLVALSDGMGSGNDAENVSSTSLSLIESFYKSGLDDHLILETVNKLLTINTEDYFTALDISIINLKDCTASFIKFGSPYGFIINDNGIKIVEGNTLPLGIIDGIKPSIATTELNDGDMVLLVTDGISDAFDSSGEMIEFLRTLPAKNPQTLADDILNHAISLNGGQVKDDMTALAVRVYKKMAS